MRSINKLKHLKIKRAPAPVMVALTVSERAAIRRDVIAMNYGRKACLFARINFRTFKKALSGHGIKQRQRDKLVQFCELVKALKVAA